MEILRLMNFGVYEFWGSWVLDFMGFGDYGSWSL